jgi:hypothetical protein
MIELDQNTTANVMAASHLKLIKKIATYWGGGAAQRVINWPGAELSTRTISPSWSYLKSTVSQSRTKLSKGGLTC